MGRGRWGARKIINEVPARKEKLHRRGEEIETDRAEEATTLGRRQPRKNEVKM